MRQPIKPLACLAALSLAFATWLGAGPCLAEPTAAADTQVEVRAEQIQQWIVQLDDDRYDSRQNAEQQIELAGKPALNAVVEAARAGSLESSTRALNILLQWSEAEEQDLCLAALENLAKLPNRPRESARAARLLAAARERAALEALTKLGAKYAGDTRTHGIGNLQVVLGPGWIGGYEGLEHLADVPRATTVSLHAAPLDEPALEKLAEIPTIQRIEVYSTQIPEEVVAKFRLDHPKLDTDYRRGALLGVRGHPQGQGSITNVEPGSAADKAGIKAGDRITEFNGKKVTDFNMLTDEISNFHPGESATLTVERATKTRKVKVTFDDWGETDVTKSAFQRPTGVPIQLRLPARQLPVPPAPIVPKNRIQPSNQKKQE